MMHIFSMFDEMLMLLYTTIVLWVVLYLNEHLFDNDNESALHENSPQNAPMKDGAYCDDTSPFPEPI